MFLGVISTCNVRNAGTTARQKIAITRQKIKNISSNLKWEKSRITKEELILLLTLKPTTQ